jgi:hypothetical protein
VPGAGQFALDAFAENASEPADSTVAWCSDRRTFKLTDDKASQTAAPPEECGPLAGRIAPRFVTAILRMTRPPGSPATVKTSMPVSPG